MIDGLIDMGSQSIEVPSSKLNFASLNGSREIFGLYSTEDNYTMFVTPEGSYSGNILGENMTIYVTGTNSQVFDLDNDNNNGSFEFTTVNFGGFGSIYCTSLGSISNYRQFFMGGCGFYNVKDGLTMNGSWSGLVLTDSNVLGTDAFTLFKEGTSLTFDGSIRSNANFGASAGSLNVASVFMDFDEANILTDGGVALDGFRTSVTDAMPNLPSSSIKVRYQNNIGISDTYIGGSMDFTTEVTTNITAVNTPVKVAGVTTYSNLVYFSGDNNNEFVYESSLSREIHISGAITFDGGANDDLTMYVRKWDDSAGAYVTVRQFSRSVSNILGGNDIAIIPFDAYTTINQNDRIELWIENNSDTTDVTALIGSYMDISKR